MALLYVIFRAFYNWLTTNVTALFDWIIGLGKDLVLWAIELLPDEIGSFFESVDWAWFTDFIQDATWIIPLWSILGIYSTALGLAFSVRLIRWVLAFIPTIGG